MSKYKRTIWFWQKMLTPHMGALAASLAQKDEKVVFVVNELLSKQRLSEGWEVAKLGKATLRIAPNKKAVVRLASNAPKNSIHFCQGISNNGLVCEAQKIIKKRELTHWVMMERPDVLGFKGHIKKAYYKMLFWYWQKHIQGVLAIGKGTNEWIANRGIDKDKIYSFAYFLRELKFSKFINLSKKNKKLSKFVFLFVGSLIELKKIDLLIKSLSNLKLKEIELWVVGDGPQKKKLEFLGQQSLSNQIRWFGTLPMSNVPKIMAQSDCLVLPSRHDGWGAVTSEALMVGTPVICSDSCGSSIVVEASNVGGIFLTKNQTCLSDLLKKQYKLGKISFKQRMKVAKWAKCLNSKSGAKYLLSILSNEIKDNIKEPWIKR